MTVGFIALWKNNQREYTASPRDEWGTNDAIQAAFANGRAAGTVPTDSTTAVGLVPAIPDLLDQPRNGRRL